MATTQSRLYKTNLAGFHQLVALDQTYINKSFNNMYILSDPASPLRSFNRKVRGVGNMTNCTLGPPKVAFLVEDNSYNYLKYYLSFNSGKLELEYGEDSVKTFDVSGWIFVFQIYIGQKPVTPGTPEYEELKKRVVFKDDFSLAKLWLDSTKADTSNRRLQAESYFGGLDWNLEPEEIRDNFDTFILKWIQAVDRDGLTLVGVSIDPANKADGATFAPTYLGKQTYPWQDPAIVPPPPPKNNNPNNMILYLMMSEQVNPPTPAVMPPNQGMWTDPSNQIEGTYALSNELFWNRWLLPFLESMNKQTQFYTTQMKVECTHDKFTAWYNWLVGQNPASASQFKFDAGVNVGYGYSFGRGVAEFDVENSAGDWQFKGEARQTGSNYNEILFMPGSQEITVNGTGKGWCRMDLKGANTPPWATYTTLSVKLTWNLTLVVQSVSEGGLEIKLKPLGPGEKYHTVTYDVVDELNWPGMWSNLAEYGQGVQRMLDDTFSWRIPTLAKDLLNKLNNQNKMFLPGSGSFFFKNGTFNSKGDFLVQVLYDGTNWDRAAALKQREEQEAQAATIVIPPPPKPLEPLELKFDFSLRKDAPGWKLYSEEDQKLMQKWVEAAL